MAPLARAFPYFIALGGGEAAVGDRDVVGAPSFTGNAYQLYDNAPTAYYDKLPASATPATFKA